MSIFRQFLGSTQAMLAYRTEWVIWAEDLPDALTSQHWTLKVILSSMTGSAPRTYRPSTRTSGGACASP